MELLLFISGCFLWEAAGRIVNQIQYNLWLVDGVEQRGQIMMENVLKYFKQSVNIYWYQIADSSSERNMKKTVDQKVWHRIKIDRL